MYLYTLNVIENFKVLEIQFKSIFAAQVIKYNSNIFNFMINFVILRK